MARRVILDTQYTFNPATRTIVIPRVIPRERLMLITNVTSNKVIFNFSDTTLTASSYTITQSSSISTFSSTTIVLAYNTTSMSATDKLQITIDEASEIFEPSEAFIDPVNKLRVSLPQSLIDTDFEYGLQPTKWETLTLMNNRPGFYTLPANPLNISAVTIPTNSNQVTVTVVGAMPAVGTPFQMQDSLFYGANGPFAIESVAGQTFTYTAKYFNFGLGTTNIYDPALTLAFLGTFYANSAYNLVTQPTYSGNTVTINTVEPHGQQVGDSVYITNSTASSNPPNGSYQIGTILSNTVFQIIANSTPTGTISGAIVTPQPVASYAHRPYDGGISFSTSSSGHNIQAARQSRRYFRYQSGKGIQISTGTVVKPTLFLDDLRTTNQTGFPGVIATTKFPHNIQPGASIIIAAANESAYNGTFTVQQVLNPVQFIYYPTTTPSANIASGIPIVSVSNWYGASTRIGIFDQQNGLFFEYDGQTLFACLRNSITQVDGISTVTNNSSIVNGATINGFIQTKYSKQLVPGDFIVIRGMTYRVVDILSDTQMTITPPFRGATPAGPVIISKTIDVKIPQSQWNLDKMDGTGPSGLNLDLTKMQMWFIDYSWYGAGSVRFGLRDTQGRVVYCHKFVNNNQNYQSYMRSGNLPARYETNTFAKSTQLVQTMGGNDTVLYVANTAGFSPTGTLLIADSTSAGYEYVVYTGTTPTSFTGLTRGQSTQIISGFTTSNVSANITTTSTVTGIQGGMYVSGPNIPQNTYVYQVINTGTLNTVTLTQAPTANASGSSLTFYQMGAAANTHVYNPLVPTTVYSHFPSFAPTISHWGTSVVMDGQFQDDLTLQFVNGETQVTTVYPGQTIALQSIRVSPSVDSGITGTLGQKEIINRMKLQLVAAEVLASGSFLINLVLNGQLTANGGTVGTFSRLATGTSSLSQVVDHTGNVAISGGETIYGFYGVNSAGAGNLSTIGADLTSIRDIGNSILGGAISNDPTKNFYPDGPDILTVTATNVGAAVATVQSRLSWKEAQA